MYAVKNVSKTTSASFFDAFTEEITSLHLLVAGATRFSVKQANAEIRSVIFIGLFEQPLK